MAKKVKKTSKKVTKKVAKKVTKKVAKKTSVKKATKKTHVAIILDQSGSMDSIRKETINSFNEQVQSIKASAGSDTFVTMTLFSDEVSIIKFAEPLENLTEITEKDYAPRGMTAMFDAIGLTVERMSKEIDDINDSNTAVLCVIITDGEENSSKTWHAEDIASLVKGKTGTKRWTFSVLGANIDLAGLADKIGIAKSNMAKFAANTKGVMRGTAVTAQSYNRYFATREKTDDLVGSSLSMDFYSSNGEVTDTTQDPADKK